VVPGFGAEHRQGMSGIATGDEVLIDNSVYLASLTYHRHQVHPDYPQWDQFRAGGQSVYPQRPKLLGPRSARWNSGAVQTGRFAGKRRRTRSPSRAPTSPPYEWSPSDKATPRSRTVVSRTSPGYGSSFTRGRGEDLAQRGAEPILCLDVEVARNQARGGEPTSCVSRSMSPPPPAPRAT
jgi:hypothetical protein